MPADAVVLVDELARGFAHLRGGQVVVLEHHDHALGGHLVDRQRRCRLQPEPGEGGGARHQQSRPAVCRSSYVVASVRHPRLPVSAGVLPVTYGHRRAPSG